jgi:hypothetical protein
MKRGLAILAILPATTLADVTLLWPTNGAVVSGIIELKASAPIGTKRVEFYRDGILVGTCVKLDAPSNLRLK